MKIAVLSDIHGNKLALDEVLADIKNNNADMIFILGDIAMGGYDPNYTIEKLFSLQKEMGENFKMIQGNTDKLIIDFSDTLFEKMHAANPLMAEALQLDDKEIKKENKEKLKTLPVNLSVNIEGVKILLTHGSPRRQDENIYPDTSPNELENIVKDVKEDIILCGHTHIPCGFSLNSGKTVINAGSIGRSMTKDKMPVYLMITINSDSECLFEHRIVKYDNRKAAEFIKSRNFASSEKFSKLYLKED